MFICMKDGFANTTGKKTKACENCKFYACKNASMNELIQTMSYSQWAIGGYYDV